MVLTGYSRNYWNWPRNLNCLPPPVAPGRVDYLGQSRDAAQRYPDIDVRGRRQAHVSRLCLYAADRKTFAQLRAEVSQIFMPNQQSISLADFN
jgi:hypothetical protein